MLPVGLPHWPGFHRQSFQFLPIESSPAFTCVLGREMRLGAFFWESWGQNFRDIANVGKHWELTPLSSTIAPSQLDRWTPIPHSTRSRVTVGVLQLWEGLSLIGRDAQGSG
jgi:hypothetical protein